MPGPVTVTRTEAEDSDAKGRFEILGHIGSVAKHPIHL